MGALGRARGGVVIRLETTGGKGAAVRARECSPSNRRNEAQAGDRPAATWSHPRIRPELGSLTGWGPRPWKAGERGDFGLEARSAGAHVEVAPSGSNGRLDGTRVQTSLCGWARAGAARGLGGTPVRSPKLFFSRGDRGASPWFERWAGSPASRSDVEVAVRMARVAWGLGRCSKVPGSGPCAGLARQAAYGPVPGSGPRIACWWEGWWSGQGAQQPAATARGRAGAGGQGWDRANGPVGAAGLPCDIF